MDYMEEKDYRRKEEKKLRYKHKRFRRRRR